LHRLGRDTLAASLLFITRVMDGIGLCRMV
jgi:hypothetical protein